jgi:hypothetical protein
MIFNFAFKITKYLIFFIALVYGTTLTIQPATDSTSSLAQFQEQILEHQRSRVKEWFSLEVNEIEKIAFNTFIKDMESMEVSAFVVFWNSYGSMRRLTTRATGRSFLKKISKGKEIFKQMKENYIIYLNKNLLKELVASNPAVNKEVLFSDAMALYNGKFRSIWDELVDPKLEKFDYMQRVFSVYREVIGYGIYHTIEYIFVDIVKNVDGPNQEELDSARRGQFSELVYLLSNDMNENWGLRWISNNNNLLLILTFFYFLQIYPEAKCAYIRWIINSINERKRIFGWVSRGLEKKLNFGFIRDGSKLTFTSNFKNPFLPHIMGDDELKNVLSTIITKLYYFCFESQ